MNEKHGTGMMWMLMITAVIIVMSIVIVRFFGEAVETQLLSGPLPAPETIKIEDDYLQIEYPWETSADRLREADTAEKKWFQESEYTDQLGKLALLLNDSAIFNSESLWLDENGRLVHTGSSKNELSYVVDMEKGIVGFGLGEEREKDDTAKKENRDELMAALYDPVHEIYRFLPAVNDVWSNQGVPVLDGLQVSQEQTLKSIYDYIHSFPRQVLYYQDVLTVILETEEHYMVLQYNPKTQKYTSCFLLAR